MPLAPSQLTIREIIGQLMMPMLPDTAELADKPVWDKAVEDLERFGFGGYIVFRGDRAQTPPMLQELQALSELPLLFSSDLERGAGQQLKGATHFPALMALGAARLADLAFQQGAITALEARQAGIHWIFAPMLDLAGKFDNPIVNTRAFGDDPSLVSYLGAAFVEGAQRHGALACAKHFPGHGASSEDSHETLPVLELSRHRLELEELRPFRHCIQAGVKSIMMGHLAVPALDESGVPASLSKRVVSDLLRDQLGFSGLIVTDALMMGSIQSRYDPGHAAVKALQAGCDVLLMPPDPEAVVTAVLRAIEEGALTKLRLLESVERIFEAKADLGLFNFGGEDAPILGDSSPDYEPAVWAIAERAITLVKADPGLLPLEGGMPVGTLVLDDDDSPEAQAGWREAISGHPEAHVVVLTEASSPERIEKALAAMADFHTILLPMFSAVKAWKNRVNLPPHLAAVPARLLAQGKRVIAISFGSPFMLREFPEVNAYVCAYSPDALSQRAAVRALWGELPFQGRLPVSEDLLVTPALSAG